jgi:hypothetical protein
MDDFSDLQTKQNSTPNKKPEKSLPAVKTADVEKAEQESFSPSVEDKE